MALIDFDLQSLPHSADTGNPGTGLSTANSTSQTALVAAGEGPGQSDGGSLVVRDHAAVMGPLGHPVPWWIGLVLVLVLIKFFAEQGEHEADYKNVRIGVSNVVTITLSSIIGTMLLKWIFGIYKVPGLSAIIEAA